MDARVLCLQASLLGVGACLAPPVSGEHFRATEASADQLVADGENVSIAIVPPQGLFICQKPGGGAFESEGDEPVVQLWIDGVRVEEKFYNQNEEDPDEFIVFETTATGPAANLEPGPHLAACTALPDWPNFDPDEDPDDAWFSCPTDHDTAEACTVSGVLVFEISVVDEAPPNIIDLSTTLDSNCSNSNPGAGDGPSTRLCSGWIDVPAGNYEFRFDCNEGSLWRVGLQSLWSINDTQKPNPVTVLDAWDQGLNSAPSSSSTGRHDITHLAVQEGGQCTARVEALATARIKLTLREEVSSGSVGDACHEMCLGEGTKVAEAAGCNCNPYCHNACEAKELSCGLPCNHDVEHGGVGYACPFLEQDIIEDPDCDFYASDSGNFEHEGACYRCGDGQQCCYSDGLDNGTGSFDLCPPVDPGPNEDQEPFGCSGIIDHCTCDVIPLCACMAISDGIEACEECIGTEELGLSCSAQGDDDDFCENALLYNFDWCGILGNPNTCTKRPQGYPNPP